MAKEKNLVFRNLTADEIEVREGSNKSLLLYKTARVDANILDETVGCFNWQKRFYQVKNTMICEISINLNYDDPTKEPIWVAKADGGDDDYTMEKVKAECSDSMKRAAFQWGIGRNLYTAPKIKIPDQFKDSKFFDVSKIGYDENGTINELVITTNFGKDVVFSFKDGKKVSQNGGNAPLQANPSESADPTLDKKGSIDKNDLKTIQAYVTALNSEERRQNFYAWLDEQFNTMSLESLSYNQGKKVLKTFGGRK